MALGYTVGIVADRKSRVLDTNIVHATIQVLDIDRGPVRVVLTVLQRNALAIDGQRDRILGAHHLAHTA